MISENDIFKVLKNYLSQDVKKQSQKSKDKTKDKFTLECFKDVYRALLNQNQSEALTCDFNKSLLSQGGDRKHGRMGFESLKSFLVNVQKCHSFEEEDQRRLGEFMLHNRTR